MKRRGATADLEALGSDYASHRLMVFGWRRIGGRTKLALRDFPGAVVAYCETGAEHPDNERFMADCVRWFNAPVERIRSDAM